MEGDRAVNRGLSTSDDVRMECKKPRMSTALRYILVHPWPIQLRVSSNAVGETMIPVWRVQSRVRGRWPLLAAIENPMMLRVVAMATQN